MIDGLTTTGSIPALQRLVQFAGARHRLITHNLANVSTPGFRPVDVSIEDFQQTLREASEEAMRGGEAGSGSLRPRDTAEVTFRDDGLTLHPSPTSEGILAHDGNDRNIERLMQDLVENFMVFRQASELLRNRYQTLNAAIRERL